jgi:excisionase family DNA binding protein
MTKPIEPQGVYTTEETKDLLKISPSTIKRLLKRGLIRANKVGGQYRIMGKEILRLLSPDIEKAAENEYLKIKKGIIDKTKDW